MAAQPPTMALAKAISPAGDVATVVATLQMTVLVRNDKPPPDGPPPHVKADKPRPPENKKPQLLMPKPAAKKPAPANDY